MELELYHLLQPRILIEYAEDHLWDRLPWALLALGVVFGGLFVIYIVKMLLGLCMLPRKYHERYVLIRVDDGSGKKFYAPSMRRRWGSFAHLMLETFFFVGIVITLWIAAHIAGFNFWTSSLVGIGLGLVGTYIFGSALQNIGAGYFVFLTDKVEEGWCISVAGVKGRITEIHPLYIEIESRDPKTGGALHHQVPMIMILTAVVTRDFNMEYNAPLLTRTDDPTMHLTGNKRDFLVDVSPEPPMDEANVAYQLKSQQPRTTNTTSAFGTLNRTINHHHQGSKRKGL